MAEFLSSGCVQELRQGHCPDSLVVQVLSSKVLNDEKYQIMLTDGKDIFFHACFTSTKEPPTPPPRNFSVVKISEGDEETTHQVVPIEGEFVLFFYNFEIIRDGKDINHLLQVENSRVPSRYF